MQVYHNQYAFSAFQISEQLPVLHSQESAYDILQPSLRCSLNDSYDNNLIECNYHSQVLSPSYDVPLLTYRRFHQTQQNVP